MLLGKPGAAGLTGFCAVIVFLPVLMIAMLSGGVTAGEASRTGLALLNTLFVVLAVGLLASAEGESLFGASRKAVILVMCILFVPAPFFLFSNSLPSWSHLAAAFSPFLRLLAAGDAKYRASPAQYWQALILLHLLGWGLLWRTSVVLRRSLREPNAMPFVLETTPTRRDPLPLARRRLEPLTKDSEPITWLEVRMTQRLADSPARLVDPKGAMTGEFQRVYRYLDKDYKVPTKDLELNPRHPIITHLSSLPGDNPLSALIIEQVFDDALLIEGLHPEPASMIGRIQKIMEAALPK